MGVGRGFDGYDKLGFDRLNHRGFDKLNHRIGLTPAAPW